MGHQAETGNVMEGAGPQQGWRGWRGWERGTQAVEIHTVEDAASFTYGSIQAVHACAPMVVLLPTWLAAT